MADALLPEQDYRFAPAPKPARLTRDLWNAVMASISQRVRAIEEKGDTLDELVADLSFNGQARIDAAITPLIAQVRQDIDAVNILIDKVISDAADAASDVTAEVRARVTLLEGRLVEVEAEFSRIVAGGVDAARVRESDERRFVTIEQRNEIGALRSDLAAARDEATWLAFTQ